MSRILLDSRDNDGVGFTTHAGPGGEKRYQLTDSDGLVVLNEAQLRRVVMVFLTQTLGFEVLADSFPGCGCSCHVEGNVCYECCSGPGLR